MEPEPENSPDVFFIFAHFQINVSNTKTGCIPLFIGMHQMFSVGDRTAG